MAAAPTPPTTVNVVHVVPHMSPMMSTGLACAGILAAFAVILVWARWQVTSRRAADVRRVAMAALGLRPETVTTTDGDGKTRTKTSYPLRVRPLHRSWRHRKIVAWRLSWPPAYYDQADRNRLEEALQATLGWHARFDWQHQAYMVTMWRSPDLPVFARYPVDSPPRAGQLRFAVAEHDRTVAWPLNTHMLPAGPSGGGKSSILRPVVADATRLGYSVVVCDIKRRWHGWRGWPCVDQVASDLPAIIHVLAAVRAEMMARYTAAELPKDDPGWRPLSSHRRVVVVFDEAEEALVQDRRGGQVLDHLASILRLGREAGVLIAPGLQSPQAALFGTSGPRSNITCKVAVGDFDPLICGAKLLGINLPPDSSHKGRAVAKIGNHESYVQGLWLANPSAEPGDDDFGDDEDRAVLDRLRAATRPLPGLFSGEGDLERTKVQAGGVQHAREHPAVNGGAERGEHPVNGAVNTPVNTGRAVSDDERAAIRRLRDDGLSVREIARQTGRSVGAVQGALKVPGAGNADG